MVKYLKKLLGIKFKNELKIDLLKTKKELKMDLLKTKKELKMDLLKTKKAYKAFNKDWTCRDFKYKVGKTYKIDEKPVICVQGFHACYELKDCLLYYPVNEDTKFAEVKILGNTNTDVRSNDSKVCTNKIKIVREIPWKKVLELTKDKNNNCGFDNQGHNNIGHHNIGNNNKGNFNKGSNNIDGDDNIGNNNKGNSNEGNYNDGDTNKGDYNKGDLNKGNNNIGDYNIGCNNKGEYNEGHYNDGYNNKGNYNEGDDNIGHGNIGNNNIGHGNTGNNNNGHANRGNNNTGHFNIGKNQNGIFNVNKKCAENKIYAFNKEIDVELFDKLKSKINCFARPEFDFMIKNKKFIKYAKKIKYFDKSIFNEITEIIQYD